MTSRPFQTKLNYHPDCNSQTVVCKTVDAYKLHANSKLSLSELKEKTPTKINLLTSVSDKNGNLQSRYTIIGTLHHNTLEEELTEVQRKKEKTKSLRKCDLSFLTAVYDRAARHIFFTYPKVLLDPLAVVSKDAKEGEPSITGKKTSVDSSTLCWSEFYILPLKVAVQVIINLYIHNNQQESVKNNIRVSKVFNDFKLKTPYEDNDALTIEITPSVVFPRLPTAFLHEGAFENIIMRSSEYILMPGETVKKSNEEGTRKRTKRSNDSSDDEEKDQDFQEEGGDHDTLAYLNADDGFDVVPSRKPTSSSSANKKNPPSSTAVITKQKQKLPQISIDLADDTGDETESTASKQPVAKRQATSTKKSPSNAGKTRVSASTIAGSLTLNELNDEVLKTAFSTTKASPSCSLPLDDSYSSSDEEDFATKVQKYISNLSESDHHGSPKIGEEVRKLMTSTLELFESLKSGNALRLSLGKTLLEKLPALSKQSLDATNPEWVDDMERLAVDKKSRVYAVKNQLGIPKDVHLPLEVYSLLFEFLKEEQPSLAEHLKAGKAMMAQPRTEAGRSVFVPMTPDQVPAGVNSSWYAFMFFQGAVNAGMTVDLFSECVSATSDGFVPELESYLSTIEKLETSYEQKLAEAKETQEKVTELAFRYLRKAELARIQAIADLKAFKSQVVKDIEEKDLEIQALKDKTSALEKELVRATKASLEVQVLKDRTNAVEKDLEVAKKVYGNTSSTKLPTLSIRPLTLTAPTKPTLPVKKQLDLEDDPIEDPDGSDEEIKQLIGSTSKSVKTKEPSTVDEFSDAF